MSGLIAKDDRKLVRELVQAGCEVRRTGTGHLRVTWRGQYVTTIGGTPGDRRAGANVRADIRRARRAGLPL